ncbi:Uncharacterized conserved protein YibQ, putative polysaccharide deacetylase 2 family [Loktanella fryxellensis]|uniref:Uncharacterized conserved protein YibQ, putative polysaccharide deacetylase 2 family n=1 Tax=Loktanella fryxellensis TaxID=245187 RepID=A0A1H7YN69_9RHOB|nr:divergent polysaccharide deacetylase family protein [Loktanella fryxellensis]SEM46619.1 Uncharacterized conserved protein YibQ, putative polysaccharide deacetylase 2 family [Loktanella fryxellensis]
MAFLKGAVWGIVIGGAGLAGLSLVTPQPGGDASPVAGREGTGAPAEAATATDVAASQTGVPVVPAADEPVGDVPVGKTPADDAPVGDTPSIDTPVASVAPATDEAGSRTAPAAAPLTDAPVIVSPAVPSVQPAPVVADDAPASRGATPAEPVAPIAGTPPATPDPAPAVPPQTAAAVIVPPSPPVEAAPVTAPTGEATVLPNPQGVAPAIPAPEADIVIGTDTATPPGPAEVTVIDDAGSIAPPSEGTALVEVLPADATPPTTPQATPADDAAGRATAAATPATSGDDMADAAPSQGSATMTVAVPEPDGGAAAVAGAETVQDADVAAPAAGNDAGADGPGADTTPGDRPGVTALIGTPTTGLPGGTGGVVVRRPAVTDPLPSDDPAPEAAPAVVSALVQYGAFHDNALDLPLMSIVILDDGSLPDGARLLADVPFAVTVLLDPSAPDAAARMADYTAAGIEVAALAAFPAGATPSDAAVTLEATFAALPRAVAVVETGDTSPDAAVTDRIVADLAVTGRGLVIPDQGLNSGLRVAADAAVPATTIYRDLDGNGQDARVIRRFVDEAAFRARQQSGIVLLGRLRPDTISALILWGSAARADEVSLAPLSATLLALPQG